MPFLQDYRCQRCETPFEFMHMKHEPPYCPNCGSTDADVQLGGRTFSTIVPMYPGAKRHKAGYIHNYVNRPAEKVSVSVPGRRGGT